MAGTNSPRIPNGLAEAPIGRSGTENSFNLLSALRRQWLLLLLATVTSGVVAYLVSAEFKSVMTTAHLQLRSRPLPLMSNSGLYTIPDANAAVDVLMSPEVLNDELIAEYQLAPAKILARQISAKADSRTGTVDVSLVLADDKDIMPALDKVGANLTQAIKDARVQSLEAHEGYTQELLASATTALDGARTIMRGELLNGLATSSRKGDSNVSNTARLQNLLTQQAQFESNLRSAERNVTRIRRDAALLTEREIGSLDRVIQRLLEERKKQIESFGKGLTSATRSFALREEMQAELQELEAALPSTAQTLNRMIDLTPLPKVASVISAKTPAISEANTPTQVSTPKEAITETPQQQLPAADVLFEWYTQVLDVGRDEIGGFDPVTERMIESTRASVAAFETNARKLSMDALDVAADIKYFQDGILAAEELIAELDADLDEAARANFNLTDQMDGVPSEELMRAETDLAQSEQQYAYLEKQLSEIKRIKECPMTEYFVSRAAMFDPAMDVKSNRKKLFAMVFLCCGLLLVSPSVLIELTRLRPTPGGVFSRRWNLPMLGIQAADRSALPKLDGSGPEMQPALRMMALRIQQSLFQPSGRVVLFSGLDHEESPLVLIRELAKCLSQREETVLIIQSLPCQLETSTRQSVGPTSGRRLKKITPGGRMPPGHETDTGPHGRAGVAEFLAGETDNASDLVINTGFPEIDFLPGGCVVNASEAMASRRMTELIDQFRDKYSIILLSGPSTLNPADLQMLAARADGIVFTVCKQSLRSVYGEEVLGDLIELGAPILGFAEQASRGRHAVPSATSHNADLPLDLSTLV